ncbi:MAG: hypothetical protein CBD99_002660 [Candidatus Pelagibacter sp. TMED239]|nr:MAG: hypothetical protein CBD99_002660 [Candidatus Pelagibacter sp. TMED239]|tara:strand:- start:458 stop:727 length:270 start_codon:yes stop_codon:yes gene_type:complete
MKIILFVLTILIGSSYSVFADTEDCNKYDKLSAEYAKCTSEIIKKKSLEIKSKTSSKIEEGKKKLKKLDLKAKLLKFKNSKSHKEFMEK